MTHIVLFVENPSLRGSKPVVSHFLCGMKDSPTQLPAADPKAATCPACREAYFTQELVEELQELILAVKDLTSVMRKPS